MIRVVGLGPGPADLLTGRAVHVLESASPVWVRTLKHPTSAVAAQFADVRSFDDEYERQPDLPSVYAAIVRRLLGEARPDVPTVYCVPGDPAVGEASVIQLRAEAIAAGVEVELVPGISFIGPTLAALQWDALDRLQLADATELALLSHAGLDPDRPALVAQVYSRLIAGDLKLVLLTQYPPSHEVMLVSGAGTADESVARIKLHELDRQATYDDTTTLGVPVIGCGDRPAGVAVDLVGWPAGGSVLTLVELVARLRGPDGCPWDMEQTHRSLRPYLLEEAHEVLSALDAEEPDALREELGDLLLQIVLHAQIASEEAAFNLADVVCAISDKIVRRHPHVFGEVVAETAEDVKARWEAIKKQERSAKGVRESPFEGIPESLPALAKAQSVLVRARRAGLVDPPDFAEPFDAAEERDQQAAETAADSRRHADAEQTDAQWQADRAAAVAAALWSAVEAAVAAGTDAESLLREHTRRKIEELEEIADREAR